MFDFSTQTAIVSGATRGIGRAISLALLESGATVIGTYGSNSEDAARFIETCTPYQDRLHLYQADISDQEQVTALYAQIEQNFDSIEILVNNAGIRRDAVVAMMKQNDWQRVIDVNATGTYLMSKPVIPLMMKNKFGRIITITSPVAQLGFAGQANYAASKAAQIAFSKSLAKEVARKKITVNCVSPGFIATDFIADLPQEQLAAYKKMVPMRRFGEPNEVAQAVLFLASAAAAYITGAVLEINGGL